METIVLVAIWISTYQFFYMREVFRKGKLSIPFLENAIDTISNYSDTHLPTHQISISLLQNNIIPNIKAFLKREEQLITVNKFIWGINAWIFFGLVFDLINPGIMFYISSALIALINIDLIKQQITIFKAKRYMKRACHRYSQYMELRETSKVALDDFLNKIDTLIESIPPDNNNNNKGSPNGRSD